ncbi:MAG: PEP-CTERM system TPR-repeat protein PrsT [Rhodocyclaceae bacterium]|nr:PEP-CTERM system TPR-repeat protein PrsT [Rhodocyclaceae bacterium]
MNLKTMLPQSHRVSLRGMAATLLTTLLLVACSDNPDELVASAKSYLQANDRPAAIIQLKNALQKAPEHAEARFLLGRISADAGDYAAASAEFSRARQGGYPDDQIVVPLALAMLKAGDAAALVEKFPAGGSLVPAAGAELAAIRGDALLQLGKSEDGKESYESALKLDNGNARARVGLARILARSGDLTQARQMAEEVVSSNPSMVEVRELLAALAMADGRNADAMEQLTQAIAADPKIPTNHFRLISLLLRDNKLTEAKAALERMKKATGGRQVYSMYLQSYVEFLEGKTEEAIANINKVVGAVPDFVAGRLLASALYLKRQDYNQALQHLGVVLSTDPGNALARRMSASAYLMGRDSEKALAAIAPLLEKTPPDGAAQLLAGQAMLARGNFDAASEYFALAAEAHPDDPAARIRLGVSRLGSGASEQAFADLEQASKLDPDGIQADVAMTMARLKQKKPEEALVAAERIVSKQPKNPLGPNLKGGALLAAGRVDEARKAFETAVALDSSYVPAVINLARIDVATGDKGAAIARLKSLLTRVPSNANAHLAFVEFLSSTGASDAEIESAVRAGVQAAPTSTSLRMALISILGRQGKTKEALTVAQEAQAAAPDDPGMVSVLAAQQLAAGNAEQAVSTYSRLLSLAPENHRSYLLLANAQMTAGSPANAEQTLGRAVRQFPEALEPTQALVAVFLKQRKFRQAAETSQKWLAAHPKSADAQLLAADVSIQQADWKPALSALRKALDLRPESRTVVFLHTTLQASGDKSGAERLAAEWLGKHPKDLVVRGYIAERLLADKAYPEAFKAYKAMTEIAPDNPLLLNNLAWVASQLGDAKAASYAEKALAIAPDNAAVLDTLGMIRSGAGQHGEAVRLLEQAAAGAPNSVPIQLNLARAYIAGSEGAKAAALLDRVGAQHPGNAALAQEIARIRSSI